MPISRNIPISDDRLWRNLMRMAQIGATPSGGCNRQTLTDLDGNARHLLAKMSQEIDLMLETDSIGNMRLLRPGRNPRKGPVAIGSHLDTQPSGGKFDGPLGVLAGLEIMQALHDAKADTEAPLLLINWTNEEGSRFTPPMLGSGVAMALLDEADCKLSTDKDGHKLGEELRRIGWQGDALPQDLLNLTAYFELHIEQGTVLVETEALIGIVTHAAPQIWLEITIHGEEAHAGSSMGGRKDALIAASDLICTVEKIARDSDARGTVGRIQAKPDSRNVVPGYVWLTAEFRASDEDTLLAMEATLHEACSKLEIRRGVTIDLKRYWTGPTTMFDEQLIGRCRSAANWLGYPCRDMPTVIGHDAVNVARRLPAALLFVPCKDGISHNEAEDITREWASAGLHVLADAVLETAGLIK